VTKLFGLVILTQKEVIQLAKEERDLGYRKGLKSKWRARVKQLSIPDSYGDSLPVKGETAGVTSDPDLVLPIE
jgi:DUF438 domain-containing protein